MQKLSRTGSRQEWRCQVCQFDNSILIEKCQMCDTKKPVNVKKYTELNKQQTSHTVIKKDVLTCLDEKCKTQNDIHQIKCKKCGKFLINQLNQEDQYESEQKSRHKKDQQKQSLVKCQKCDFDNDPFNITCVNCQVRLKKKRAPRKPKVRAPYRRGANFCEDCNTYKRLVGIGQFECNCPDPDDGVPIEKTFCNYCFKNIELGKYDEHIENCQQRKIFYDQTKNKSFQRCTKLQIQTMIYMHKKCQKLHFGKQKKLQTRITKLGYTNKDLQNLYYYIVNYAPIIIHMHVNTHMQFFVKDTHYRSQFQTSKSSGSLSRTARTQWQDRMFDQKHHNAKDSERVKYGTMNFTNDPQGVAVCTGYGQSYFLLKEHVRDRCTMTDMDSSSPAATICTFRFCYHLLCKLSDIQIKAAFQGSKAQQIKSAGVIGAYKQIQIHGPVEFKKDIERVYISKAQVAMNPDCMKLIKQFCQKNGLDYQQFGEVPKPIVPGGGMFGAPGFAGSIYGVPGYAGSMFGGPVYPGGSFAMSSGFGSLPSSGLFLHPKPAYRAPIKYTAVSFPYSSKKAQDQQSDSDQDYI